jgi:hypothetical protein
MPIYTATFFSRHIIRGKKANQAERPSLGPYIGHVIMLIKIYVKKKCRGPALAGWPTTGWATPEGCPYNLRIYLAI